MYEAIRFFWNAAAVAGAIVVGVFTHDAGLVAVTLLGGLIAPRILGLVPRRGFLGMARGACGPWGRGGWGGGGRPGHGWDPTRRFSAWHEQAHGQSSVPPAAPPTSAV